MYVDESGDTGVTNSPTPFFVLSSLIVHELRWAASLDQLIAFRRRMRDTFGLKMSDEIHAAAMIRGPGNLAHIKRNDRLTIVRMFADEIAKLPDVRAINVVAIKRPGDTSATIFDRAWRALLQRFENTIASANFPGPKNPEERGIVYCDNTDARLNSLLRRMRRYNPIPNQSQFGSGYRNLRLNYIIEDPVHRDSRTTYFIQAVDTIAYLIYQGKEPNAYMRRKGARKYFRRLAPIYLLRASLKNRYGIVVV
ncbi:MAG TPA: DUF3800 domain-containing protein [Thermoanaerobaculia bacterium]